MATDREIALEQALIAVLGAALTRGLDVDDVVSHGTALLLGNSKFRSVEHPHVSNAIKELSAAHAEALVRNRL